MPNFTKAEFACPHCHVALVRPRLITLLELTRKVINRPIPIVSGYRCPVHNKNIGGAADSQHMYAAAADIPPKLLTPYEAKRVGFTGVGVKGPWAIHVDVRDGPFTTWRY